jgi:hypothetical protein
MNLLTLAFLSLLMVFVNFSKVAAIIFGILAITCGVINFVVDVKISKRLKKYD